MTYQVSLMAVAVACALPWQAANAAGSCWVWSPQDTVAGMTAAPRAASVALDGTGAAWVLASEDVVDGGRVRARQQAQGGGWLPPVDLAESPTTRYVHVDIHADASGNALATWTHSTARFETRAYAAGYRATQGWEQPRRLEPKSQGAPPVVAMAPNGYSLVQSTSMVTLSPIQLRSWSPLAGWGETQASRPSNISRGTHALAVNNAGQAVMTWTTPGKVWSVHRAAADGAWSRVEALNAPGQHTAFRDSRRAPVALTEQGEAMVAWSDQDKPAHAQIRTRRLQLGSGVWQPSMMLSGDNKLNAVDPQVAMNEAGQAMVAWRRIKDRVWDEQVQSRRDLGDGWAPLERPAPAGASIGLPQLTMGPDGHTVTAWLYVGDTETALHGGVASTVQLAGGRRITTSHAPPDAANAQRRFWLAHNPQGDVLLAWDDAAADGSYRLVTQRGAMQQGTSCGP